jgi:hypothetical protein
VIESAKANIELCPTPLLLDFVLSPPPCDGQDDPFSGTNNLLKEACKNRLTQKNKN